MSKKKITAQPLTFKLKKVNQHKQTWVWPKTDFIAYKKVYGRDRWGASVPLIATLLIPASATKIAGDFNHRRAAKLPDLPRLGKCRATSAKVLKIYNVASGETRKVAYSMHDSTFKYEVGKTVAPHTVFEIKKIKACSGGIHFFITKEEAISY
jgi:hypothetical protein